jgi:hypothetical protein
MTSQVRRLESQSKLLNQWAVSIIILKINQDSCSALNTTASSHCHSIPLYLYSPSSLFLDFFYLNPSHFSLIEDVFPRRWQTHPFVSTIELTLPNLPRIYKYCEQGMEKVPQGFLPL